MTGQSKRAWLWEMYRWQLLRRAVRRPLPDALGWSWDNRVWRLGENAGGGHEVTGLWCVALWCRRRATHRVWFKFRARGGQVREGELFYCSRHGGRYARHRALRIQDMPGGAS